MNRTFVMCKPDAVERGLVGEIVARLERKGLAPRRRRAALGRHGDLAEEHYAEHADKPFYGELVDVPHPVARVRDGRGGPGRQHVLARPHARRRHQGRRRRSPGTIRGDFATITTENLVHASDGHESAAREIALWFPGV